MNLITAISGSGPGFVFRLMEAFIGIGIKLGLSREVAQHLVMTTFKGSVLLADALKGKKDLIELRNMVTSKGGTTEAGLKEFHDRDIEGHLFMVIEAAMHRGEELEKGIRSHLLK